MKPAAYYNEIDPFAAAVLRQLIKAGEIAPGEVDERSIEDICPDDLKSFTQCHFFAGIGVWSYGLRRAGWPDNRPVWTGSCPCQPFSAAGKRGGFADERHLWPHCHWLINQCRPECFLGEQTASQDGLAWFDLVSADLEGSGYAVGAVDTCSAGVGAPHIRQRLRFMAQRLADAEYAKRRPVYQYRENGCQRQDRQRQETYGLIGTCSEIRGMAHANADGCQPGREGCEAPRHRKAAQSDCCTGRMADADDARPQGRGGMPGSAAQCAAGPGGGAGGYADAGPVNGHWRDADWLFCRDGVWRPVEPGTFPLAHGAPARVGRLRGYGNAVDAEATRIFAEAVIEVVR